MAITDVKQYAHLSDEDVEALGRELDAIRTDIEESRGERDARYIRRSVQLATRSIIPTIPAARIEAATRAAQICTVCP